jgi:hypothetical protein
MRFTRLLPRMPRGPPRFPYDAADSRPRRIPCRDAGGRPLAGDPKSERGHYLSLASEALSPGQRGVLACPHTIVIHGAAISFKMGEIMRIYRGLIVGAAVVFAAVVGASPALAASVHLKGGANAEPSFTDGGLFLEAAGALAGLGNGDVLVSLTATGLPTADCVNPGSGEHRPPGQNPAEVTLTGVQRIPESEIKNGTTPFDVATESPVTPVPGAPECPNQNWIENITDVAFTSATITVEQPPGTLVLTVTCTISPPSSDGSIPGSSVTCQSS